MRQNTRKQLPEFPTPAILTAPDTIQAFKNIIQNLDKKAIKDDLYKGKFKDTVTGKERFAVRELLMELYHNKCAYCEDIEAKPDVEHYRPKKGVTGENHLGYYWLCYEWSNLLPACRFCNTEGGKRNKFPILGIRSAAPVFDNLGNIDFSANRSNTSPLIDEKPYLLNPEIDTPDDGTYFRFGNNGNIEGIDAEERGARTIEICDLDRQTLRLRRQKNILDEILEAIQIALKLYFEENEINETAFSRMLELIFIKMQEKTQSDQPFSLFALFIYDHFEEMLVPLLPTPVQREAVKLAMEQFKTTVA